VTAIGDGSRRSCPWCGATTGPRIWWEAGFAYVRCAACRGVYADLTEAEYEGARHNAWDEHAPSAEATGFYGLARAHVHAEFLRRHAPRGAARLLDVGCGMGYFLERAKAAGWDVYGCDTSAAWVAAANARLGDERVLRAPASASLFDGQRFDLVTAWDVVEHIYDPLPFLRTLAALLAPGGIVFLRTPNLRYVLPVYRLRRGLGQDVELGPTNHVVYFDSRSMTRALQTAGLRPVDWPALPPPQVATFAAGADGRYAPHRAVSVRLKNGYAAACRLAARVTGGRAYFASDLDVVAAPA
jgi:SAM-dependent methyltransferase